MVLVEELRLIDQNLHSLGQRLQQRLARLSQTGLPASNDDLLLLRREHKVSAYLIHTRTDQRRVVGAEEHVRRPQGVLFSFGLAFVHVRKENSRSPSKYLNYETLIINMSSSVSRIIIG
jgi:hypothetical protein